MEIFSNLHFWRYFQAFFYPQTMESKSSSSLGLLSEDMAVLRLSSVTVMMIMIMVTMVEMMTMMIMIMIMMVEMMTMMTAR